MGTIYLPIDLFLLRIVNNRTNAMVVEISRSSEPLNNSLKIDRVGIFNRGALFDLCGK